MKESPTIFITGATGFLGGAVIAQLIESKTPCRLVALVRGENNESCLHRVVKSVARFTDESQVSKLLAITEVISGDLTDQKWQNNTRINQVTHVLHLAANTSFGIEPGMKETNVDGTIAVGSAFRDRAQLKRFIHVGTSMICGSNPSCVVHEDDYPKKGVRHLVPYTAMKAEAEMLLSYLSPNLPLIVARPSIVVGHTKLGCTPSGSIFWAFRAVHALKKVAWPIENRIDVVPVDYVARSIVHLLLKPQLLYQQYHISAGEGSSNWLEIGEEFSRVLGDAPNGPYRAVEFSEITEDFLQECLGLGPTKHMLRALKPYYGFGEIDVVFDNSRLLSEGMASPPSFTSYLEPCMQTSVHRSVYHQMRED